MVQRFKTRAGEYDDIVLALRGAAALAIELGVWSQRVVTLLFPLERIRSD